MFGGFSAQKLKPQLKMAVNRIQIASNKKSALLKQSMREVAVMLADEPPKEEKAKIRAEALIRDDNLIEAYEILQLECEMLHERIKLIEMSNTCPKDLVPVVATLIWASARVDIPELMMIRKQFRAKYGKTFEADALGNVNGILNERVVMKLSVEPPAAYLVQTYLERICEQFQVDYKPSVPLTAQQMAEPMAVPVGYSVAVAQGTGLGPVEVPVVGQPTAAEEEEALKQNGGIPPHFATATEVTPMVPPPVNGSSGASNVSSLTGVGGKPSSAPAPAAAGNADDFAEPDIYIPGPPTAPPGSGGGYKKDNDDDDNNNNNGGVAAAPGGGDQNTNLSSSYADLAARFENLKR